MHRYVGWLISAGLAICAAVANGSDRENGADRHSAPPPGVQVAPAANPAAPNPSGATPAQPAPAHTRTPPAKKEADRPALPPGHPDLGRVKRPESAGGVGGAGPRQAAGAREQTKGAPVAGGANPPGTPPLATPPTPAPTPNGAPAATTLAPATPAAEPVAAGPPVQVVFELMQSHKDLGKITLELDSAKAPATVANFLRYVDEGYYSSTVFDRVLADSLIQGGGCIGKNAPKTAGLHEPVKSEARNGLRNLRGTVAMARTWGNPDSATVQFYINLRDNPAFDVGNANANGGYAVFGRIVEGMEVLERIARATVDPNPKLPAERSFPVPPPTIRRAYRAGAAPPPVGVMTQPTGEGSAPVPTSGPAPAELPPGVEQPVVVPPPPQQSVPAPPMPQPVPGEPVPAPPTSEPMPSPAPAPETPPDAPSD